MKKIHVAYVFTAVAVLALILVMRCHPHNSPQASSPDADSVDAGPARSTVRVVNGTKDPVLVTVAFGSNSGVLPASWPFCIPVDSGAVACTFSLNGRRFRDLPIAGQYLNATFAFGTPNVGCGSTKAELNINNPQPWYDVMDVSLVDGYSNNVFIEVRDPDGSGGVVLGPPQGEMGNERVFGLFPLGCDICVARDQPSCGRAPGKLGCKGGTQYNPDVPCQYQGPFMGGGSDIQIYYVGNLTPLSRPY